MSRSALSELSQSVLGTLSDQRQRFASASDDELRTALLAYRERALQEGFAVAKGLGVAMSAREGMSTNESAVKRSVLYFDEVILPDPVFSLTDWVRDRQRMPAEDRGPPRDELVTATRCMQALAPLVKIGRVRFVPTSHVLEPPQQLPFHLPEAPFYTSVPEPVRAWLEQRARVVKVVVDAGRRLVFPDPPDSTTSSIQVDFGQLGSVMSYDHYRVVEVRDDGIVFGATAPPDDAEALARWVRHSISGSAAALLKEVLADVAMSAAMRCTHVTNCETTAQILEKFGGCATGTTAAALSLRLPVLDTASVEQLAELIEREPDSFNALRLELRHASESIAGIDDHRARVEAARQAEQRLAREQVYEVERKMQEAKRALKWEIPLTFTQLAAGALGLLGGDISGLIVAGGAVGGGATAAAALRKFYEYRGLPGYFLWKLGQSR